MHLIPEDAILQGPVSEVEHKQSLTKRADLQIDPQSEVKPFVYKKKREKRKIEKGTRAAG